MMSKTRLAGSAGLIAVVVLGGAAIGSVAASTTSRTTATSTAATAPGPADPSGAANVDTYCTAFRSALAARLGVDPAALSAAARAAAASTIDAAVADGALSNAVGDRLKARLEASDADQCARLTARLRHLRMTAGPSVGVAADVRAAAADALGLTTGELAIRLRSGLTLQEIATEQGVAYPSVSAAVVTAAKQGLDAAVAAGKVDQVRADRILARLEQALAQGRFRAIPGGAMSPAPRARGSSAPG